MPGLPPPGLALTGAWTPKDRVTLLHHYDLFGDACSFVLTRLLDRQNCESIFFAPRPYHSQINSNHKAVKYSKPLNPAP